MKMLLGLSYIESYQGVCSSFTHT